MSEFLQSKIIRTFHLTFDMRIFARQTRQWRGAFISMAGWENPIFHNHKTEEGFLFPYPLVQYRMYKDHAAIFAINQGVEALQEVLATTDWTIQWGDEKRTLRVENLKMNEHHLRMLNKPKRYKMFNWLALNQKNYEKWMACKKLTERIELLEQILASQIINFCGTMGYQLPERLEINLQQMMQMKQVKCFGNPMVAFNVVYDANLMLPNHIAFGRGVSLGFGWQVPHTIFPKRRRNASGAVEEQMLLG